MKFETKAIFLFVLISVIFLSVVSAQNTLIIGKVYKSDRGSEAIGGAKVTVKCGGVAEITYSSNEASIVGTYVVNISDTICKEEDSVIVVAELSGWKGTDTAIVQECGSNEACNEAQATNIAVSNPLMVKPTTTTRRSSGGGGGGTVTRTVNNTVNTSNTAAVNTTVQNISVVDPANAAIPEENGVISIDVNNQTEENDLSAVTGSFIANTAGSWLAVVILVIFIIALILLIKMFRSARR